jgi:hypothetical protein
MGIVKQFGDGVVAAKVDEFKKRFETATIFMLTALGESLVKWAKDNHNYTDRTGNLTNSIGYVVVHDKKVANSGFSSQPGKGSDKGFKLAMKMAAETQSAFSLIIVAGMNYAAYVEAKGYNVILPAELKAKSDFPAAMKKLMDMAKSKMSNLYGIN